VKQIGWFIAGTLFALLVGRADADNGVIRAKRIELFDESGNIRVVLGPDRVADYGFIALISEEGSRQALLTDWFVQWTKGGTVKKEVVSWE